MSVSDYTSNLNFSVGPFNEVDLLSIFLGLTSPIFIFFGIQVLNIVLGLLGAAAGGYIMVLGLGVYDTYIAANTGDTIDPNVRIGLVVGMALVFAILLIRFTKLGIFVMGALGGLFVGNAVFTFVVANYSNELPTSIGTFHLIVEGVSAIAGGILAIYFVEKILVRVMSAFVGGYMLIGSVDHGLLRAGWVAAAPLAPEVFFVNNPGNFGCDGQVSCYILLAAWVVLFAAGVFVQFKFYKNKNEKFENKKGYKEVIVRHKYEDDEDSEEKPRRRKRRQRRRRHSDEDED